MSSLSLNRSNCLAETEQSKMQKNALKNTVKMRNAGLKAISDLFRRTDEDTEERKEKKIVQKGKTREVYEKERISCLKGFSE